MNRMVEILARNIVLKATWWRRPGWVASQIQAEKQAMISSTKIPADATQMRAAFEARQESLTFTKR